MNGKTSLTTLANHGMNSIFFWVRFPWEKARGFVPAAAAAEAAAEAEADAAPTPAQIGREK